MNKLFIIGNGFDRDHALPTSYSDFQSYLMRTYPGIDVDTAKVPDGSPGSHGEIIWNKKEVAAYLIRLISRSEEEQWGHIEKTLGELDFEEDFERLPACYDRDGERNFFHEIYNNEELASHLALCVPLINDFFQEWIEQIDVSKAVQKKDFRNMIDVQKDYFLNFNYTDTLQYVYGARQVCHIHGKRGEQILFGHGDDCRKEQEEARSYIGCENGLESLWAALKKDTQRALKRHKDFFEKLAFDVSAVYSYGFSYEEADLIYVKKICSILNTEGITWYLNDYTSGKEREGYCRAIERSGFRGRFDTFHMEGPR